jgi:hypothetical protein
MKNTPSKAGLLFWAIALILLPEINACKGQEKTPNSNQGVSDEIEMVLNLGWFHSHEEGGGDTLSFRHKPFDFPPSRGRVGFILMENERLEYWAIGPTDIPEKLQGSWNIADGNLYFSVKGSEMVSGFEASYRIIKAEKDLFILLRK